MSLQENLKIAAGVLGIILAVVLAAAILTTAAKRISFDIWYDDMVRELITETVREDCLK